MAAFSIALWGTRSKYFSEHEASRVKPYHVIFPEITLAQAGEMHTSATTSQPINRRVIKSGDKYLVDKYIEIFPHTIQVEQNLAFWVSVNRLTRIGLYFFGLAAGILMGGVKFLKPRYGKIGALGSLIPISIFAWTAFSRLRLVNTQIEQLNSISCEEAIKRFATIRQNSYPTWFGLLRKELSQYVHPKEIEFTYYDDLDSMKDSCTTPAEKAAWVRSFLQTGGEIFQEKFNTDVWALKERFSKVCKDFSEFNAFYERHPMRMKFKPFSSLSKILGSAALPILTCKAPQKLARTCEPYALEALLRIQPNGAPILEAYQLALESDAIFYDSAQEIFMKAKGRRTVSSRHLHDVGPDGKPLHDRFSAEVVQKLRDFQPPAIPKFEPLKANQLEAFMETAKSLVPLRATQQEYHEYLEHLRKNMSIQLPRQAPHE